MTQPLIKGSQIDGSTLTSVDASTLGGQPVGVGANDILALNGSSQIPAVNGSLLTSVDALTLGGFSVGVGANNIVQLNGSSQLPAVDGSLLTGLDGGTIGAVWKYDNPIVSADPGAGFFRLNNLTLASATEMYVDIETADGADFNSILSAINTGDRMYVQNSEDSIERLLVTVSSTTDNTGWWTIVFTVDDSNSTFTDNDRFAMLLMLGSQGSSTPAAIHQSLGTITAATDIGPDAGTSVDFTFGAAATAEVGFLASTNAVVETTVEIVNGGQGTLTWGAEVDWAGGVAPTLTAAGTDILKFL